MRPPTPRALLGAAFAAVMSFVLAACSNPNDDASITADLRTQLEGSDVCALLIAPEWPIEKGADLLSGAGVDALIAADLVRREPVENRAKETPQARISITETGRPYLQLHTFGADASPSPYLCFGKKQIKGIARGDDGVVRYSYRIVGAPAWAQRSDMRAAFPFLVRLLDQEQHAQVGAVQKDGRWQLPGGPLQTNLAELGNTGFYPCPYPNALPGEDPCR